MSEKKPEQDEVKKQPAKRPAPTCVACGKPLYGYDHSGYGGWCDNPRCSINDHGSGGTW